MNKEPTGVQLKAFIKKIMDKCAINNTMAITSLLEGLSTLKDFKEASQEFLKAKAEYIQYLEKYQGEYNKGTLPLDVFPGLNQGKPTYSKETMQQDSKEMQELASTIQELGSYIELLEDQLLGSLKKIQETIKSSITLTDQASTYLDQYITNLDSAYDVGGITAEK